MTPADTARAAFERSLAEQRERYERDLPGRVDEIERLWQAIAAGSGGVHFLPLLERAAHSLAGSGAVFGHRELGSAARVLELRAGALRSAAAASLAGPDIDALGAAVGRLRALSTPRS